MAHTPNVERRLSELEGRVRLLERKLAMQQVLGTPIADEPQIEAEAPALVSQPPLVTIESSPEQVESTLPIEAPPIADAAPSTEAPSVTPGPVWPPPPVRTERAPLDLERLIGTRFFAAIGAVVVVIGIGLFVRLAYQKGWLNHISPAAKCWSGAVFAGMLIASGEVIRRRFGALASAGVSAAGLGSLFAVVYAAFGIYRLLPAPAAFVLLAATAGLGFAIAARGNLVSIGVIALVAAYVNPLIIGPAVAGPLILPAYLLALLCAALALSAWRAYPFRPLRALAWWGTLIYGGSWCADAGLAHPGAALAFFFGVWAVVHAELAVASKHPYIAKPATDLEFEIVWNRARFIATSFSSSAWTAALAVNVLREGARVADWWPPALMALVAAMLAIRLAGSLRILRDVPKTDLERLGAGLAMQAGALLMTAVALALSGWLEVAAWLTLGLAAIAAGRWIRSRGLDVYGLLALTIAAARLVTYDSPFVSGQPWEIDLGGIVLTRWAVLMALAAASWAGASRLLRPGEGVWRTLRTATLIAALSSLNLGLIHPRADGLVVCVAWLVLGLAGILLGRAKRERALTIYGLVVLAVSTGRFLMGAPITGGQSGVLLAAVGLVITRWSLVMMTGAGAWLIAGLLARAKTNEAAEQVPIRTACVGVGFAMLLAAFLHPQAHAASVAHVWLVLAAIAALAHGAVRRAGLEWCAVAGLAASGLAWAIGYAPGWMDSATLVPRQGLVSSFAIAAVAIGCGLWLDALRGVATKPSLLRTMIGPGTAILLFASTSLEVARIAGILSSEPAARRAAVSIWWGVVGVGCIGAGFWRNVAPVRHAGLILVLVATVKAAAFDLASVPQLWRVASFVGLGLLMLGVAVGYAKASARTSRPERVV